MQVTGGEASSGSAREQAGVIRRLAGLRSVQVAAGFLLILAVMGRIEFSGPAILDNDGYYHIRWSRMLRESFPRLPEFKALPLTTLNEKEYVDHHFLFHVLLIPFTGGDLRFGAKLAAAFYSSLGLASLFALLVYYKVPYRFLWLIPLVGSSEPFLYRMSMTRAPSLSLVLLGIGTLFIYKRKPLLVGLLAFVFVWLYSLFPLLLVFALVHSATVYLCERELHFRTTLGAASGILAGLVINPYFPKNLVLLKEHLMKAAPTYAVDVGIEWYPYETWTILELSAVAFALFFAGLIAFDYRRRIYDSKPLFFLIVSTILLLLAFKSRRFIEYWPPFAVLFAAFTIGPRIRRPRRSWTMRVRDRMILALGASALTVMMVMGVGFNLFQAAQDVSLEEDPYDYRGAADWLAANTPPGTRVFNTDWDEFPMLFYYNPAATYIVGLDPTYLYDRDHELWKLYASVTLGEEENPAPIIRDRFNAEYVVVDDQHRDFMEMAEDSGDFETVFTDPANNFKVLRIRPRTDE